jgi:hypothetical protein
MLFKRDSKQDSVNHARTTRVFLFYTLAFELYDRDPHAIRHPRRHTMYVTDSQLHTDLVRWNRADTSSPCWLNKSIIITQVTCGSVTDSTESNKANNETPCLCGNFSDTGVKQVRLEAGEPGPSILHMN